MPPDSDYTLAELASLADVSPRTIRYYVAQGLLSSPDAAGPATRYPGSALARLKLIKQLQRQHLPLAEIRRQLATLTDEEALELTAAPVEAPTGSALDYVRSLLTPEQSPPARMPRLEGRPLLKEVTPLLREVPPPRYAPKMEEGLERPAELDYLRGEPDLRTEGAGAPATPSRPPSAATTATTPTTPTPPERSQWERIVLEPDVELHVRRPLSRIANKRIDRLLAFARQLLEEDKP